MKPNHRSVLLLASLVLALGAPTGWGAAPPNPTPSDDGGNTAGGGHALYMNEGRENTAFGWAALMWGRNGDYNSGFGVATLVLNDTGGKNTAMGYRALGNADTGNENTATGFQALGGVYSDFYGVLAGDYNTATGSNALSMTSTGRNNTADGAWALKKNTTGYSNTASGADALESNTVGFANTAAGGWALSKNEGGDYNTAVGFGALLNQTSGNNNLAVGNSAGRNLTSGSNNVYLGHGGTASESGTMRLGSVQTRAFIAGVRGRSTGLADAVAVYIDSRGQLGTVSSSRRFKQDIRDMGDASRRLFELRPVTYRYREPHPDGYSPMEYGLIAEEVAGVYPDLVVRGVDGQTETVQYHKLTPMLLNEVQRLGKLLQAEKDGNLAHEAIIHIQGQAIAKLTQQMAALQSQQRRVLAVVSHLDAKPASAQVAAAVGPESGR